LPPKELRVLWLLVSRAGEIVTKDELALGAWPQASPSDESIARCIHVLRVALGPQGGDLVRTVYGKGYLFAEQVKATLSKSKLASISAHTDASDPAAVALYEASRLAVRGTPADVARSLTLLTDALALDRNYAAAYGAIADLWIGKAIRGFSAAAEVQTAILQACRSALAINPDLTSAIAAEGWLIGVIERQRDAGLQRLNQALKFEPQFANALYYRSWIHRSFGEHQLAIADIVAANAAASDEGAYKPALAYELLCARRYDEALAETRRPAISLQGLVALNGFRAAIASYLGHHDEAVAAGRAAAAVSQRDPTALTSLVYALARAGDRCSAQAVLDEILQSTTRPVVLSLMPAAFIALDQFESAIEWLKLANARRCPWLGGALRDPRLEPIARDPDVLAIADQFPSA
jgi:DNA-binding winged helix-turn-helix (wHTH) protein